MSLESKMKLILIVSNSAIRSKKKIMIKLKLMINNILICKKMMSFQTNNPIDQ